MSVRRLLTPSSAVFKAWASEVKSLSFVLAIYVYFTTPQTARDLETLRLALPGPLL